MLGVVIQFAKKEENHIFFGVLTQKINLESKGSHHE